jgi:hypothetical protein
MVQLFVLIVLNIRSLLVIIYTTYCNIKGLCIFTITYVNVFGRILTINSYYFLKEHQQVGPFVPSYFSLNFEAYW